MSNIPSLSRKNPSILELKAELYSIFRTAKLLEEQRVWGGIDSDFYRRKIASFAQDINRIEQLSEVHNISLKQLISQLHLSKDLEKLYPIIIATGENFIKDPNNKNNEVESQLKYAALSAEISSKFITIIDYLHLLSSSMDFPDWDLIDDLFDELIIVLKKSTIFNPFFHKIHELKMAIRQLRLSNRTYNELAQSLVELEEYINSIFNDFKEHLSIVS